VDAEHELANRLWSLLYAEAGPLTVAQIAEWLRMEPSAVPAVVDALANRLQDTPFLVRTVAGGVALATRPAYTAFLDEVGGRRGPEPLSHAAWECLAVIAWRQPVTRAEIEAVRQVNSERALDTLVARGLIAEVGRKEAPGRPILYGTTPRFLKEFGLGSLDDLPPAPFAAAP